MRLPAVGSTFHGYAIEAELGSGGFSTVYRAIEVATGAVFALKVLRPDAGSDYTPRRLRRFQREVDVLIRLQSPNIVQLHNYGQTPDGLLYMMFELIEGADLSEWMKQGPMSPPVVRSILAQVLDALADAHDAGVLHRDVKPANIRVWNEHGVRTKLLDFGIARPLEVAGPALTATGELVGTVRFLAPEQLRGDEPTAASDLYSLGLVAFEMVTGERSDRARIAHGARIRIEPQQLPDEVLRNLLNQMLRDDPAARPPSARAARHALDRTPASESRSIIEAQPAAPTNWRIASAGGVVAAVAILGLAAYLSQRTQTAPEPPRIPTALPVSAAPSPAITAPEPEPDAAAPPVDLGSRPTPQRGGCGFDPPFIGRNRLQALNGMTVQEVVAHVPRSYDSAVPHPIVILLHQWGDDPGKFLDVTRFAGLAEQEGFIVIAPGDSAFYPWADPEDMDHVRWALNLARDQLCIDDRRVYGVGNGDGGMIVEQMPCELDVAAIATTAFRSRRAQIECYWHDDDVQPVPYLIVSPTKDGYNPIEGGRGCSDDVKISLADKEKSWRERYGCSERFDTRKIRTSECRSYRGCKAPLESCHVNGGHNWPDTPRRISDYKECDGKPADFPYRDTIWDFLAQHSRD